MTELRENAAKAPEGGSFQSKTGNVISLVQQRTFMDGQHIVCSLAKETELYKKPSKPQIKGQSKLKRLEMSNIITKNHRKILVVLLKESIKSMKLENFFGKKKKYFLNFQEKHHF